VIVLRGRRSVVFIGAAVSATALTVAAPVDLKVAKLSTSIDVASASAAQCLSDGTGCSVGSVGPGGGIVFYDAGSPQWWGRFLEAKTTSVPANGPWGGDLRFPTVVNKEVGMGRLNSYILLARGTNEDRDNIYLRHYESYFTSIEGEFYLPSKNELDTLYNYWKISGDKRLEYAAAPMWTSSEASSTFAWYQLFHDGTQFTDANGIIRGLKGNKDFLDSPVHFGSDFKSTNFQIVGVRAFPVTDGRAKAILKAHEIVFEGDYHLPVGGPVDLTVGATTSNAQCSSGGANTVCKVGDIGPGGGIVYYDAGKDEYWGRYLEIAPKQCEGVRLPWRPAGNVKTVYTRLGSQSDAELRLLAKGLGMGKVNTRVITLAFGAGAKPYAAKFAEDSTCGGKDDWFLPSKDELDIAFNRLAQNRVAGNATPVGGFDKGYYWTSTDYNNSTAWTQYFMDGQQFDRVQTLDGNRNPPNPFRVRAIRAFGTSDVVACKDGGPCKVGDTGPGGGTVFYVAPDLLIAKGKQWRYIEAYTSFRRTVTLCPYPDNKRVETHGSFGSGYENTQVLVKRCGGPRILEYRTRMLGGKIGNKTDWYIPGFDELEFAAKYLKLNGEYWSSQVVGRKAKEAFVLIQGEKHRAPVTASYPVIPFRRFGS